MRLIKALGSKPRVALTTGSMRLQLAIHISAASSSASGTIWACKLDLFDCEVVARLERQHGLAHRTLNPESIGQESGRRSTPAARSQKLVTSASASMRIHCARARWSKNLTRRSSLELRASMRLAPLGLGPRSGRSKPDGKRAHRSNRLGMQASPASAK